MANDVKGLEKELIEMQKLNIHIRGDDSEIQAIGNAYAVIPGLYTNKTILEKMIRDIKEATKEYMKGSYQAGKTLSLNSLEKWLDRSELLDIKQAKLAMINRANKKQINGLLSIEMAELNAQGALLKSQIDIDRARLILGGMPKKDAVKLLVQSGADKNGLVQGFVKRAESVAAGAARRARADGETAEYLKKYPPDQKYQWITISSKPCPDCQARAGMVMTYNEFIAFGLPGTGHTICGKHCMCNIIPFALAEERFTDVKQFTWKSKDLVLTSGMEERKMKAAKYQPGNN